MIFKEKRSEIKCRNSDEWIFFKPQVRLIIYEAVRSIGECFVAIVGESRETTIYEQLIPMWVVSNDTRRQSYSDVF